MIFQNHSRQPLLFCCGAGLEPNFNAKRQWHLAATGTFLLVSSCFRLRISAGIHMRTENVAAIEKNIAFFFQKCWNRCILETEGRTRPCQDRHSAIGFVAHREPIHSAPTDARIPSQHRKIKQRRSRHENCSCLRKWSDFSAFWSHLRQASLPLIWNLH